MTVDELLATVPSLYDIVVHVSHHPEDAIALSGYVASNEFDEEAEGIAELSKDAKGLTDVLLPIFLRKHPTWVDCIKAVSYNPSWKPYLHPTVPTIDNIAELDWREREWYIKLVSIAPQWLEEQMEDPTFLQGLVDQAVAQHQTDLAGAIMGFTHEYDLVLRPILFDRILGSSRDFMQRYENANEAQRIEMETMLSQARMYVLTGIIRYVSRHNTEPRLLEACVSAIENIGGNVPSLDIRQATQNLPLTLQARTWPRFMRANPTPSQIGGGVHACPGWQEQWEHVKAERRHSRARNRT